MRPTADILLADGSVASVRQIQPGDAAAVLRLHGRLSDRSRYLRYFSAYPAIPARDLERLVTVDHHRREAFGVERDGELIAVGRYDRLVQQPEQAEVAFEVEDAFQRRGLGSVLLEHLAQAAREEGIATFVADVLPANAAMLRVFSSAGYPVAQRYADGVVRLSFPIANTARSIAVRRLREHHAEVASISRLLRPRSVAVFGANAEGTGTGSAVLRHLLAGGFTGSVYPVDPANPRLAELPTVPNAAAAPGPVDLAVLALGADRVADAVVDCAVAGVCGLVVLSEGYAEAGPAGEVAQARLVRLVRRYGMRLIGPNCLGVANAEVRLNATMAALMPPAGDLGIFSQSAVLGAALLAGTRARGLGVRTFVSVGNRADVSGNDMLQFWRDDERTAVVLLYLETFGNPRKFARLARDLARSKPVVAVAATVRPPALDAVATGPDEHGIDALFAASGMIRVETVGELLDVAALARQRPLPAGGRLAVVTNAAALGALAVAAAAGAGLEPVDGYPVVLPQQAPLLAVTEAVGVAMADARADLLLVAYAQPMVDDTAGGADAVAAVSAAIGVAAAKPVAGVFVGTPSAGTGEESNLLAVYPGVAEAVRALGRLAGYATWRAQPAGVVPQYPDIDPERARGRVAAIAASALHSAGVPAGVASLLECYGIAVVPSTLASGAAAVVAAAEEFGVPVAVKVASQRLLRRVDLGAVRLDLRGTRSVARAYADLCRRFGSGVEVLVQPMVAPGVGCAVEVVEDPAFGAVVGFGRSDVVSDLLGERVWRATPLTDVDAMAMVRTPRAAPLLTGGPPDVRPDLEALAELLIRVGQLADDHPRLRRLELNPVIARPDGVSVLHASVQIGKRTLRPDSGPRRLG